ncbi:glycosyltransferase family protein [Candidatus Nomurabacteria bacterium]|nr:glycosyltransferase family protein [Candidatus Nomurabacteria bacterium]
MIASIIQARVGSTRLPGKILKPILGVSMLGRMIERVKRAKRPDVIIVATTEKPEDDVTVRLAKKCGVMVFRGSERDVLDRFYGAAKEVGADMVVRLTGDCPLMDPAVIDLVIDSFQESRKIFDYCSTPSNYPEGLDVEIFTFSTLEEMAHEARLPSEREHVSLFIKNHSDRFTSKSLRDGDSDNSSMHWSVDTQADFDFVTKIFERLYPTNPFFDREDILALLTKHQEILEINKGGTGYEGLAKSLREDEEAENKLKV